jgi:hypothetical protein
MGVGGVVVFAGSVLQPTSIDPPQKVEATKKAMIRFIFISQARILRFARVYRCIEVVARLAHFR